MMLVIQMKKEVSMINTYYQAEQMWKHHQIRYNSLGGLNVRKNVQSKINIVGHLDDFTLKTLYENYEEIAGNLGVYPTITIFPRGHELDGGMGGLYYADQNHIEMVDHYYLVSILAHEMRHAFQYIYFPDYYFATSYRTAKQYLKTFIEEDARKYSIDYCIVKGYSEEAQALKDYEAKIQLVIQNKLPLKELQMNNSYFWRNPFKASSVTRDYHWISRNKGEYYTYVEEDDSDVIIYNQSRKGCGKRLQQIISACLIIFVFYIFIFDSDDSPNTVVQDPYILENSATTYLTESDLVGLSAEELRLARNEIYARHGFIFGPKDLQSYFEKQSWYKPNPNYSDSLLSNIEHKNIEIIQVYE